MPGISGFALHVPPYRVQLSDWCAWTGQPWEKVRRVVGRSFRMRGPEHDVYALAATAVLRLVEAYDIDPAAVGYLALGTESSSDNSAGAVIVKGLVDEALAARGAPTLARDCEVPEYKHACLGGVYALKGGLRYLAADGSGRQAIVVCADIAEYERGSSGEPTQGAGAVAMLLEAEPRLLEVDLAAAGSASAYRVLDFRKPFSRFPGQAPRANGQVQDTPVFNGRYSTTCYVDAVRHALTAMVAKRGADVLECLQSLDAVFMHRPYRRMPATAWGMLWLFALAEEAPEQLDALSQRAGLDAGAVRRELASQPHAAELLRGGRIEQEFYPLAAELLRQLRETEPYRGWVTRRMRLGAERMLDLGNLYTAALPAWLAAGLEQAREEGEELAGQTWLAIGYGSGDAAEAIPLRPVAGWDKAARRIRFDRALADAVDLSRTQYAQLHAGRVPEDLAHTPAGEFVIDGLGTGERRDFDDAGVAFHAYAGAGVGASCSSYELP